MFLKCWTQGEIFHLSLLPPLLLLLLLHSHRDSIHSSSGTVERKLFSWCWCEKHACTQTNTLPTNWHHRSMCEQFDVTTNIIAHEKWYFLTHWMCESMWTIPCVVWKMGEKKTKSRKHELRKQLFKHVYHELAVKNQTWIQTSKNFQRKRYKGIKFCNIDEMIYYSLIWLLFGNGVCAYVCVCFSVFVWFIFIDYI